MTDAMVVRRHEFDAGHRVATHEGKCRSPHGHRYVVEVAVRGGIPSSGMVIDFGVLADAMAKVIDTRYDHAFLVAADDHRMRTALNADDTWKVVVMANPPTAENLAVQLGHELRWELHSSGLELVSITVHETPKSRAVVSGRDL